MLRTLRSTLLLLVLLVPAAAAAGCTTKYIHNTDVEDTEENRKIIVFLEGYRRGVERQDVAQLLKMASTEYYEDGGNLDASDDIDYAGLKDYLLDRFSDARAIRYEIRYRRVVVEDDVVHVDYTYSASYKFAGARGEEWRRKVEENRLTLVPHEDEFRITGGM